MRRPIRLKKNPVLIAGYDVLFFGEKGFSTLSKAKRILVRKKGSKKSDPWDVIDVSRRRSASTKGKSLTDYIMRETKRSDIDFKAKKRKVKKKVKKAKDINFREKGDEPKLIRSLDGKLREIRKIYFEPDKNIEFVKGKEFDFFAVQAYLNAVKGEVKRLFREFGPTEYLVRILHDYKGLKSTDINDPLEKGFSGYSLNRQRFDSEEDIDEQFDLILGQDYPEHFSKYMTIANANTYFTFSGFTAEMTVYVESEKEKYRRTRRKSTRRKTKVVKKSKKPKTKVKKKKPVKKKQTKKKRKKPIKKKSRKK